MLILIFEVGEGTFALDIRRVSEVIPRIPLRPIPHTLPSLVGVFNHGGSPVPVLDLGLLLHGAPCPPLLSTRIILSRLARPEGGDLPLGLVAEKVGELRDVPESLWAESDSPYENAPYLGRIVEIEGRLVQALRLEGILTEKQREGLYGVMLGAGHAS